MTKFKKNRILMIVPRIPPDVGEVAELCHDMAHSFHQDAFDVAVLAASDSVEQDAPPTIYNRLSVTDIEPLREPLLFQFVQDAGHSLTATLKKTEAPPRPFDLIWVIGPELKALNYALRMKKKYGIPVWLHAMGGGRIIFPGNIGQGIKARMQAQTVQRLIDQVDVVSACGFEAIKRYRACTTKNQPVIRLHPWIPSSLPIETRGVVRTAMQKTVRLLIAGEWDEKQDVLRFCKRLRPSTADFRLNILTTGEKAALLHNWVHAEKDPRFTVTDYPLTGITAETWANTDLFVIPQKTMSEDIFLPTLYHTALYRQVPILGVSDERTELFKELNENLAGPVYTWEQMDEVDALLQVLPEYPGMLHHWRENAARFSESRSQKAVMKRYKKIAHTICG